MIILRHSLEQKEFVSKLTKVKATIGRGRKELAKRIYESAAKDEQKGIELGKRILNKDNKPLTQAEKDLRNKLLREEVPKGVTHSMGSLPHMHETKVKDSFIPHRVENVNNESVYRLKDKKGRKALRKLKEGKGLINLDNTATPGTVAHEIGHAKNATEGGVSQFISKTNANSKSKAQRFKPKEQLERRVEGLMEKYEGRQPWMEPVKGKKAFKDVVDNIKSNVSTLAEESNATRKGLKMLKKHGASPQQLKEAKEGLGEALDTYKLGAKRDIKSSVARLVDIPSRRNHKGSIFS